MQIDLLRPPRSTVTNKRNQTKNTKSLPISTDLVKVVKQYQTQRVKLFRQVI